jgi:hypothetical protein
MNEISAQLEAALVRALRATWKDLNDAHFKSALRPPVIELSEAATRLGQWRADRRAIELSRPFVLQGEWGAVVEVLKHEMAHQYVHEVLGNPDDTAHGPAFRALCERLGIDGRAAGTPAAAAPESEEGRLYARIAKLLALAESSNVHEAELAMAEAQRLMLRHNLSAPASTKGGSYGWRHLGRPSGRVSEQERALANLLGEHFFVEAIWVPVWRPLEGKRGSVLEICGAPVNLEMAAYVHAFLLQTADRLWEEYRRTRKLDGNRERRTFLAGVVAGFHEKLDRERARQREAGLVWVGDGDLGRWFRRRHPYIRMTRYDGARRTEAHAHGKAAGAGVVLHKPVGGGSPEGGRRLLLGR